MKPLISVLIAAYRAKKWLPGCLDAALRQTLPPGWEIEILLGVDACEDTLETVQRLADPRVTRLYFNRNVGPYVVFNTLMRHAKGSLICRFDADDVMLDDYLASQIEAHEAGADITRTWFIFTHENLQPANHVLAHEFYHPAGGLSTHPSDGQFVLSRRIWDNLGGFRPWPCSADTEYFMRAELAGFSAQVVERHLYLRRTHQDSLTAHPDTNFKSALRINLERLTQGYKDAMSSSIMNLFVAPECAHAHYIV